MVIIKEVPMRTESGKIIKQMREELAFSQRLFAEKLGITQAYVYLIEAHHIPSRHVIQDIINIYLSESKKSEDQKAQLVKELKDEIVKSYKQNLLKAVNKKMQHYHY